MSDENNIFEEETQQNTSEAGDNNSSAPKEGYYQQGTASDSGQYYNASSNANSSYQAASDKSEGVGFGVASMVLGIVALVFFCSGINILLAMLAIVFGSIQLVRGHKKGMAITGIVTSAISIVMFVGMILLTVFIFGNSAFWNLLTDEMDEYYYDENEVTINGQDIHSQEELEDILEDYLEGEYNIHIQGGDHSGDYDIQKNEDGSYTVNIIGQDDNGRYSIDMKISEDGQIIDDGTL